MTTLVIAPTTVAMAVGDSRGLSVTTGTGIPVTGVTWTSSDPSVVTVSPDNDGTIIVEGLGQATVTATLGGLTAQATVRVLPGAVAPGERIWAAAPMPGRYLQAPIRANPVSDDDPDIFSVEVDPANSSSAVVRAVRGADGTTLWSESVGYPYRPQADAYGGFLVQASVPSSGPSATVSSLRRIGGGGIAPWEYVSAYFISDFAAAPDGAVYLAEYVLNGEAFIVGLDGKTGAVRFRVPMPLSTSEDPVFAGPTCPDIRRSKSGGLFGEISVLENGDAAVQCLVGHARWSPKCSNPAEGTIAPGEGTVFRSHTARLFRVTAAGGVTATVLDAWSQSWPDTQGGSPGIGAQQIVGRATRPDGRGGVLATWSKTTITDLPTVDQFYTVEGRVSRVVGGTLVADRPAPWATDDHGESAAVAVTDVGTVYLPEGPNRELVARATDDWTVRWSAPHSQYGTPIQGLDDGGLMQLASDSSGSHIQVLDASGTVVHSYPTALGSPLVVLRDQGVVHGLDQTGLLAAVSAPHPVSAQWSFLQGQFTACTPPRFLAETPTKHKGLVPRVAPYTYRFVDNSALPPNDPGLWNEEQKVAVRAAFAIWNATNAHPLSGLITRFREFDPAAGDVQQDMTLRKENLGVSNRIPIAGRFAGGGRLPDGRITGGLMSFSTNDQILLRGKGYQKVALHETGHALGLEHPWGDGPQPQSFPVQRGGTVMNNLGFPNNALLNQRRDDPIGNISNAPTSCDRKGVLDASTL